METSHSREADVIGTMMPRSDPTGATTGAQQVPIGYFASNPYQPRLTIDAGKLHSLVASIREFGFRGTLDARYHPAYPGGRLELAFGHRRLKAAELAGLATIPTVIRDYTDEQMRRLAFIENATHEPISDWEQGHYFKQMMDELGMTMEQVGESIRKSKGYVQNRVDLLRVPEGPLRDALMAGEDKLVAVAGVMLNLSSTIGPEAWNDLYAAYRQGDVTLDDLKAMRKARTEGLDRMLTPQRPQTHTISLAEQEAMAQIEADRAEVVGPDPDKVIEHIEPAYDGNGKITRLVIDRAVFAPKTGLDRAIDTLYQVDGIMPHLRRNAAGAAFEALPAEDLDRLREHKAEIVDLIAV